MQRFGDLTGRRYGLFEYLRDPDAEGGKAIAVLDPTREPGADGELHTRAAKHTPDTEAMRPAVVAPFAGNRQS